ncbi:metal ABC transporter permease [Streptomyces sp. URMC 123]|uniref:metal ABC transporter permease n=1 Tax=Streptomyces sp. URMC 123 TaxID=3423403 RepID=UPI003F19F8FF
MEILNYAFMQRALIAAVLVGVTAPAVGIYLVQRRQAIMGDGIGHVALTGVALGALTSTNPVWTATVVSALGAVAMELIRWYGKTRGDLALAMLFYGGMAGGVLLINLAPNGSTNNLTSYLFGSITTVSDEDVWAIALLAAFVALVTLGLRRQLFAICQDEEFARVTGLPVRTLNLLLAVTAAVTVTVAMRVVGLLLVSALMVVPVAAAQQATRGFGATMALSVGIGVTVALAGTTFSFYEDVPPGASIVLLAIAAFAVVTALAVPLTRRRNRGRGAPPTGEECTWRTPGEPSPGDDVRVQPSGSTSPGTMGQAVRKDR